MDWKAEGIEGLDEEYQHKLQELTRQQEELEREYELRKRLYIAANSKVSRSCMHSFSSILSSLPQRKTFHTARIPSIRMKRRKSRTKV